MFAHGLHLDPEMAEDGPKTAQDGQRWPQDGPKTAQLNLNGR